jgi:hypothetical protein
MSRRTAAALYDHAERVLTGEPSRCLAAALSRAADEHMRLVEAVERLQAAAWWTADRPCYGDALWTELRRAAGLER